MSKPKKHRPSFDVARPETGDTRAGWVYRSDRPAEPTIAPEVELIPPGRGTLQRVPPEPVLPETAAVMLPLSALSFGLGVAMMPVFATMYVMLVPMRWLLGAPPASQTAGGPR
jgi:hypothetical protein